MGQARDYDFVLYENGQPKLTIIMLDDRNHYKLRAVRLAHEASEQAGVPCMNKHGFIHSKFFLFLYKRSILLLFLIEMFISRRVKVHEL